MKQIDLEEVAEKYNSLTTIWDKNDKWHFWTYRMITKFISQFKNKYSNKGSFKILNAGSAGNSYGFNEKDVLHIDIADEKIAHLENKIIGSVESLPVKDCQYNLVLCVGSVLNYCDPVKTINEFNRVLENNGYLILEFENSNTLELIGKNEFNKKAVWADTFYFGQEQIWYYSTNYIMELLCINGFHLIQKDISHIISPLIYRYTKSEKIASLFCRLDNIFKRLPFIRNVSSNTILLLQKRI